MKKIIKRWGNSLVITFNKEEIQMYELKKGDILDLFITKEKKTK